MVPHDGLDPIGILGAGGQAKELAEYCGRRVSFLSAGSAFLTAGETEYPLICLEDPPSGLQDTAVVIGVGAPAVKRTLVDQWPGVRFATVRAEGSYVASSASIADGAVLAPLSAVMAGATIGAHVLVNVGASISHDSSVGDFATVSPGARVGGGCRIGRGVFIGIGATVKDGVTIGDGAVVGAGAVVIADVEEYEVVAGVPAKRLRLADDWMREF